MQLNKNELRPLIISHNVISDNTNNGKTIKSIFKNFKDTNISQIYFRNETPNSDFNSRFYKITDYNILKSFFSFSNECGSEINGKQINTPTRLSLYKTKPTFLYILRDLLWLLRKNKNINLENWLKKCNPSFIFFVASNNTFSYDFALKLSTQKNLPLIIYFTDDYIFQNKKYNIFKVLHRYFIMKRFIAACEISILRLVIGNKLGDAYSLITGKKFETVMNLPVLFNNEVENIHDNGIFVFLYIGNLSLNRWKSLLHIAEIIESLNTNYINLELRIYSFENLTQNITNEFKKYKFVKFMGSESNELKIYQIIKSANVVLHVESFEKKMIEITKFSISTKISEYLAYGKCILAYGPNEIASINFLRENGLSISCISDEELNNAIFKIISGNYNFIDFENRAFNYFQKNMKDFDLKILLKDFFND